MPVMLPNWQPEAPLQEVDTPWLQRAGVSLACLRLDLIDPLISGNKWFKLALHLRAAAQQGAEGVLSVGGPHSNHLHALAAAGKRFGFATVGLLRGQPQATPTVNDLRTFGMQLHWLDYASYRQRREAAFWQQWSAIHPQFYPVEEGGSGLPGALGCKVLRDQVTSQLASIGWEDYDGWWLAVGSGTTLAGLVMAEQGARQVYGALAVPQKYGVERQIDPLLAQQGMSSGYCLLPAADKGFGHHDAALLDAIAALETETGLPLDPVYTGKALIALRAEVEQGRFARGQRLIFVHTGGLQGRQAAFGSSSTD